MPPPQGARVNLDFWTAAQEVAAQARVTSVRWDAELTNSGGDLVMKLTAINFILLRDPGA